MNFMKYVMLFVWSVEKLYNYTTRRATKQSCIHSHYNAWNGAFLAPARSLARLHAHTLQRSFMFVFVTFAIIFFYNFLGENI